MTTDNYGDTRGYSNVKTNGLWPYIDSRVLAYGPRVRLSEAYGLTYTTNVVKAVAEGLRWSSAVTGDLTCKDWPITGQKVRRRTTIEST